MAFIIIFSHYSDGHFQQSKRIKTYERRTENQLGIARDLFSGNSSIIAALPGLGTGSGNNLAKSCIFTFYLAPVNYESYPNIDIGLLSFSAYGHSGPRPAQRRRHLYHLSRRHLQTLHRHAWQQAHCIRSPLWLPGRLQLWRQHLVFYRFTGANSVLHHAAG